VPLYVKRMSIIDYYSFAEAAPAQGRVVGKISPDKEHVMEI
jgi:hypothetical protein